MVLFDILAGDTFCARDQTSMLKDGYSKSNLSIRACLIRTNTCQCPLRYKYKLWVALTGFFLEGVPEEVIKEKCSMFYIIQKYVPMSHFTFFGKCWATGQPFGTLRHKLCSLCWAIVFG